MVSRDAGKPGVRNQTRSPGRRGVVGDGMVGRFDDVKQGDLSGARLPPGRSQRSRSSKAAG